MQSADGETPWERGRFDARSGPQALLFGRMYEDPAIEAEALPTAGRVLCIASAGCMARALAERHDVVAVDINPVQLAYARRRLAGAPYEAGVAERLLDALRRLLPLAGVSRRDLVDFLDMDDPAAQAEVWRRVATRRLHLGVRGLLSLSALRVVYSYPLLEVLPRGFGRVLLGRLARGFAIHPNRENPFARALLVGEGAGEPTTPAAGPIELVRDDAAAYLEGQPAGSFTGFTLSNILDGASAAYRARLLAALRRAGAPGSVAVLRSFAEPAEPSAGERAARDRSMIWGSVEMLPVGERP